MSTSATSFDPSATPSTTHTESGPRRRLLPCVVGLGALMLAASTAGCGSDTGSAEASGMVDLEGQLTMFDQETYVALPGEVTFNYLNLDTIPHSLIIEGEGAPSPEEFRMAVPTQGTTVTESVALEPGTYLMVCDITGHREAGMVADLTVG